MLSVPVLLPYRADADAADADAADPDAADADAADPDAADPDAVGSRAAVAAVGSRADADIVALMLMR